MKKMSIDQYERYSKSKVPTVVTEVKSSGGTLTLDQIAMMGGSRNAQAMQIEAFYSCVRDKAESIGQIPNKLFRRQKDGNRTRVHDGRAYKIWVTRPNDYMTWQAFKEMMVMSLETNGAFYAYPEYNTRNELMGIIPFRNQSNVVPNMDVHGQVYYTYSTNDGKPVIAAYPEDLFIITMMTSDGYTPIRPVSQMATLLSISGAQEDSYKQLQENGITAQMALSTDNIFKDPNAIERLKEDWGTYRGPSGRGRIPILENGLKPVSLQLTPQEMDFLKSREFSVDRIARMTRVPLHRVGMGSTNAKGADVNSADELYMQNSLNPILMKYEEQCRKLMDKNSNLEFEVDRKAFYAGSPWRLVEAVTEEFKHCGCTLNEMREDLGREPVEGGDVFALDTNNITLGKLEDLEEIQARIYGNQNQEGGQNERENSETEG